MNKADKRKITLAYQNLERLLREHLPFKREGSIHSDVHLKLTQSRFSFELSWDEHEDQHVAVIEEDPK